ncbi:hypothetical protein [Novosphingobium gossypii]|uniref:hypothetical protein n=1 Tax=Novosphingobium gossypii TaxID=1604774 RepID=UPI003D1AEB53
MNPIPIGWCLAGAGAAALLGAWGGYAVCDWRRDSADLAKLQAAVAQVEKETGRLKAAGDKLEESRAIERSASTVRESTIREIYRDRPAAADCALDPAAGRVLDDAIATANRRAAGEPDGAVSARRGPP